MRIKSININICVSFRLTASIVTISGTQNCYEPQVSLHHYHTKDLSICPSHCQLITLLTISFRKLKKYCAMSSAHVKVAERMRSILPGGMETRLGSRRAVKNDCESFSVSFTQSDTVFFSSV